jgi:hypothetical protein
MGINKAKLIETWFNDYRDDGEFSHQERFYPYTVIGPSSKAGRIVFATKPARVGLEIERYGDRASIGLIGRYGLPSADDAKWIRRLVGNHELWFLGDLDPPDLLILAWLRARLRPKRVEHLGINDSYLDELQVCLPDSFAMKCSLSERRSLPLLQKAFPRLSAIVGARCAELLEHGRKIELEAVVSAIGATAPILQPIVFPRARHTMGKAKQWTLDKRPWNASSRS